MMLTICIHISHHIHFRKVKFHENYSKSIRSGNQHTDVHLLPWSNCLPLLSTALICRSLLPKHSKARRTSRRRKRPQRQRPRLLLRSKWSCKRPRFVWASFCWVIQKSWNGLGSDDCLRLEPMQIQFWIFQSSCHYLWNAVAPRDFQHRAKQVVLQLSRLPGSQASKKNQKEYCHQACSMFSHGLTGSNLWVYVQNFLVFCSTPSSQLPLRQLPNAGGSQSRRPVQSTRHEGPMWF